MRPGALATVLFLVGAPRSGTSLLYRALCLHPGSAFISNYLRRTPGLAPISVLNRAARMWPGLARRMWFGESSNAYRYGESRSPLERVFPGPVEGEPVFARCGLGEAGGGPLGDQAGRLRAAFEALRRFGGGSTVVSKRIANNRRIEALAAIFPEARFVAMVRDGRAVAASLAKVDWWETSTVWWYGGTPRLWREEGRDPWELCALNWVREVREVERGLAVLEPSRVMRLAYERLVADPIEELGRVADFAGLPTSAAWLAQLGRLRFPDRNQAWRGELGAAEAARIEELQSEELARHGYL